VLSKLVVGRIRKKLTVCSCERDLIEDVHVVQVPPFYFPLTKVEDQIPSLAEWNELWKAWDMVTLEMIPKELLNEKPIHLRHPCIFYIGKIGI
jgi:L-histidine Nalpha-methyltransferase / hercynylcysteine S-oxide synthase